ncbi:MAG: hypothetical protein ACOY45_05205 [Pseudomonadota bacterium]
MTRKSTNAALAAVRAKRARLGIVPEFEPVRVRPRHDGWLPERQRAFLDALAESGCVDAACARVGMSPQSAYALRRRPDAERFRTAWDAALDLAVRRLGDAAFSRALHGVARPVFFQGEQIGERRYFDERLTMFLLRYRDPTRYGAWLDRMEAHRQPDAAAQAFDRLARDAVEDARADQQGRPRKKRAPFALQRVVEPGQYEAEAEAAAEAARAAAARCNVESESRGDAPRVPPGDAPTGDVS